MSRLYGRAFDVYQTSIELKNSNLEKYKEDNKKISLDELINSTDVLDIYLPESAIDYIVNYPIHIVKSPLVPRNMTQLPTLLERHATIYFKGIYLKEEQKRELSFFLGSVLSMMNPDELPKENNLPCEYGDTLSLLLEYLYLLENNKEDRFVIKHLNELKWNAERYSKIYETYQKHLLSSRENELSIVSEKTLSKIEDFNYRYEKDFLKSTLDFLVPLSSLDGVLQIIDNTKTKEGFKNIIELLYNNPDNNRQELLNDYGIDSYGYKRLRKEIESKRIK